jgi:PAS domain-containing protein
MRARCGHAEKERREEARQRDGRQQAGHDADRGGRKAAADERAHDVGRVLVNPAAERLLGRASPKLLGRRAAELRLDPYLSGPVPRLVDRAFAGKGSLEVRRSTFYRDGKPHQLIVFSDVSRALREQEQIAWAANRPRPVA